MSAQCSYRYPDDTAHGASPEHGSIDCKLEAGHRGPHQVARAQVEAAAARVGLAVFGAPAEAPSAEGSCTQEERELADALAGAAERAQAVGVEPLVAMARLVLERARRLCDCDGDHDDRTCGWCHCGKARPCPAEQETCERRIREAVAAEREQGRRGGVPLAGKGE